MNEERQDRYGRSGRSLDSGGPLPRFGSNTAEPRPTRRAQQLLNNQRPPAQYFGGTFAAQAPAQAPAAVPTSEELRIQIDVEKSKDTKDYNRLGQLTSQLQAREEQGHERLQPTWTAHVPAAGQGGAGRESQRAADGDPGGGGPGGLRPVPGAAGA